jgi:hypothetical protein
VNAALDRLLQDALSRSIRDQESIGEDKRYELLAMQPLVFARLAGLLAAHACLREDPLRKVIEALLLGYMTTIMTTAMVLSATGATTTRSRRRDRTVVAALCLS